MEIALEDLGQAEISDLAQLTATRPVDEHVGRFEIAMDDVLSVHVPQREHDVLKEASAPVDTEPTPLLPVERVCERFTVHVLEDREWDDYRVAGPRDGELGLGVVEEPNHVRVRCRLLRHGPEDGGLS